MMLFVKKVGVLRNLTRSQVDSFVNSIPSSMDYMVKDNFWNSAEYPSLNKYKLIIFKKEK